MSAHLAIMIPVFDDWESVQALLPRLDAELAAASLAATVVAIDDGSTEDPPRTFGMSGAGAVTDVWVVSLARNLGHQRAIAVGLAWIQANLPGSAVVVMDADGQDDPRYVPELLAACREGDFRSVVFAARARRSESVAFQLGYGAYRLAHRVLVGRDIRIGNFSIVPPRALDRLMAVSELWNHYAAAVLKARLPFITIPTERATRIEGEPKMRLVSLVTHGLSAMSVDGDVIGTRLLVAASMLVAAGIAAMIVVLVLRLLAPDAMPGWATLTFAVLGLLVVQAITAALLFAFVTLSSRNTLGFLPKRDAAYFVMSATRHVTRPTGLGFAPPTSTEP